MHRKAVLSSPLDGLNEYSFVTVYVLSVSSTALVAPSLVFDVPLYQPSKVRG